MYSNHDKKVSDDTELILYSNISDEKKLLLSFPMGPVGN